MKQYNTAALLQSQKAQTENLIDIAVQQWQMIPPAKFSKQPAENAWSAKQCLAHLNSYGDYYLLQIEKAILLAKEKKLQPAEIFVPGIVGNYFTNIMKSGPDGEPVKKMKSPKSHSPVNNGGSNMIIAEFINQQEKLLQLLDAATHINISKAKVPVSIAKFIKLKLGDVFMFLIAHNMRHTIQAQRALQAAGIKTEIITTKI
ncbi:MAG TPA: DinB family protein [Chitinophagaceae bacterium]|nr:DinB family protein [Chitinophagaceae bacterium]